MPLRAARSPSPWCDSPRRQIDPAAGCAALLASGGRPVVGSLLFETIRFPDEATHKRALGFLIGRFSGHSWASGEVAVPEEALVPMAREGIPYTVEGPATNERILSLRTSLAVGV